MQGRGAGSDAGDPRRGAAPRARAPRAARVTRRPAAALVRRGLCELRGARMDARRRARGERRARAARDADARRARARVRRRARRRRRPRTRSLSRGRGAGGARSRRAGSRCFFEYWESGRSARRRRARRRSASRSAGSSSEWQQRTRRRYGALALFADVTLVVARAARCVMLPLLSSRGGGATGGGWRRCSRPTRPRSARRERACCEALLGVDAPPDWRAMNVRRTAARPDGR